MDDHASSYAPRSPDLSAYQSTPPPSGPSPSSFSPLAPSATSASATSAHLQHQSYQPPSFASNLSYGQAQQHQHQQQHQLSYQHPTGLPPTHLAPPPQQQLHHQLHQHQFHQQHQQHQHQQSPQPPPLQQAQHEQSYYAPAQLANPYVQAQYQSYGEPMLTSPLQAGSSSGGLPHQQHMDAEWTPDQQEQQQEGQGGAGAATAAGAGAGGRAGGRAGRGPGRKSKKPKLEPEKLDKLAPGVAEGIEVKTKFPVARIKRIMQADDDVGKVAQVTPTAVSKALELFMISLVTRSAEQARAKQSKKVTGAHLKHVIQSDAQFDFLDEIVAGVPDVTAPAKKSKEGVTTGEDDSDGGGGGGGGGGGLAGEAAGKKRKARSRRKVKDEDEDF